MGPGLMSSADFFWLIFAALRRRAREGGSYHVRISLTRAAMWFASLGRFPTTSDFDPNDPQHKMSAPETLKGRPPTVKATA